jgi:hypothetical protein
MSAKEKVTWLLSGCFCVGFVLSQFSRAPREAPVIAAPLCDDCVQGCREIRCLEFRLPEDTDKPRYLEESVWQTIMSCESHGWSYSGGASARMKPPIDELMECDESHNDNGLLIKAWGVGGPGTDGYDIVCDPSSAEWDENEYSGGNACSQGGGGGT